MTITDEQLDKLERYAHPKTDDGRVIRRLVEELRVGAKNMGHLRRERDQLASDLASVTLAVGELGYKIARDGADVLLVPIEEGAT